MQLWFPAPAVAQDKDSKISKTSRPHSQLPGPTVCCEGEWWFSTGQAPVLPWRLQATSPPAISPAPALHHPALQTQRWLFGKMLLVSGFGCPPGHVSDEGTRAWPSWAAAAAAVKTGQPRVEAQGWKQCAAKGDAEVAPEQSGSPLAPSGSAANSTIQSLKLGRGTPASSFLFRTCICPTLTSLPKGFTHMCGMLKER